MLRRHRRPGHPSRRRRDHRLRQAASDREIPEKPYDARLRPTGRSFWSARRSTTPTSRRSSASRSVTRATFRSFTRRCTASARPRWPRRLPSAGFARVNILASQRTPDGDFPNVPGHVSNPEIPRTLEAAIAEARATGADLVLASDPDADRIGVAVPSTGDPRGEWTTLDGNQIGVLLAAFVMKETEALGRLRADHYLVTTLVSTQMAAALATREGIRTEDDLLVGFKWIAERIDQAGFAGFLFGFEESHGYLKGTHVRDKDAAVASLLFAELAATLKDRKQTVVEYLDDLYVDVGHYGEHLINKVYKGREGLEKIQALMKAYRTDPPKTIAGLAVTEVYDYQTHEIRRSGDRQPARPLPQPSGDLLIFHTALPGVRFAARPSGTEPKIKFYLFGRTEVKGPTHLTQAKAETASRLDRMANRSKNMLRESTRDPGGSSSEQVVRRAGRVGAPHLRGPSTRNAMCRISPVGEDWVKKGCHVHVGCVELVLCPDHLGGIVFRSPFSSAMQWELDAAAGLVTGMLEDPTWRQTQRDCRKGDGTPHGSPRDDARPGQGETVRVANARPCSRTMGEEMMASCVDFLRTGQSGKPLMRNVARSGAQSTWASRRLVQPKDIRISGSIGSLELTFYRLPDGTAPFLVSISLYFHAPSTNPPDSLEFTGWLPSHETTFDDFREFLDHSALRVDGGVASGPHQHLVLASGVRVTFR